MANYKIFGRKPVLEALTAGVPLKRVYVKAGAQGPAIQELLNRLEARHIPVTFLKKFDLDQMAGGQHHQGVLAVMEKIQPAALEDVLALSDKESRPAVALLDGIEDPQNFGAILRVAEATGIRAVIYPRRRSAGLSPGVVKASAGAVFHLTVAEVTNLARSMDALKEAGFWMVGADMAGDRLPWEVDLSMPVGFVLGSEGQGLHRLIREKCDFHVRIPMPGKIQSLNVTTAAAMLFYERLRQRETKTP